MKRFLRIAFTLALATLVSACDGMMSRNFVGAAAATGATAPVPITRAEMSNGWIVVESPPGYCVDPATQSDSFVLIAACQYLANGTVQRPAHAALITLTLGPEAEPADLPSPEALAEMVGAPFIEGTAHSGLVTARIATGGDSLFPGSDPEYWRGAMVQGGHMLGLALYAPKDSMLAEADTQGERVLRRLMERIELLSPRQAADAEGVSLGGSQ